MQSLHTDEVDDRVENAIMDGRTSQQDKDQNLDSFVAYQNALEEEHKRKTDDGDNDSVW